MPGFGPFFWKTRWEKHTQAKVCLKCKTNFFLNSLIKIRYWCRFPASLWNFLSSLNLSILSPLSVQRLSGCQDQKMVKYGPTMCMILYMHEWTWITFMVVYKHAYGYAKMRKNLLFCAKTHTIISRPCDVKRHCRQQSTHVQSNTYHETYRLWPCNHIVTGRPTPPRDGWIVFF